MTSFRVPAALLTAGVLAALLTGCGSDNGGSGGSGGSGAAGTGAAGAASGAASGAAAPKADSDSGGGDTDGPCGVTDQATIASVFPGAGAGKPGQVRNCEYTFASGTLQAVNIYLYEEITLDQFTKQDKENGISFEAVSGVGDKAIRDQLHTLTVQQGDTLFSVQALPRDGITETKLAPFDSRVLSLAKKIADAL